MSNIQDIQPKNTIPETYSFGLIGHPLGHSLSPLIHAAALHAVRIRGEYSLYPVRPFPEGENELIALLNRVKYGEIHGLNVTIPHKQNVIPLLDKLTPAAATIGAVNTIFVQDGVLVGDNTDALGFWEDLQRLALSGKRDTYAAIVLGAGGSAHAVVYALLTHGYQVTIAARRIEQAQKLCDQLSAVSDPFSTVNGPPSAVELSPTTISNLQSPISLLVNTTPVGMHPKEDVSPWPTEIPLPKGAAVYDLVYNPRETLLIKRAREIGVPATTGLGMLIEQAALAFERWTGIKAPRDVMMDAVYR